MIKRGWTEEEDNLIRELAPNVSLQRLAVKVKRTNGSVIHRAKTLNVEVRRAARLARRERA